MKIIKKIIKYISKKRLANLLIPLFLLFGSLLIYKHIYPEPRNWYDHFLYLTKSILKGYVSVDDIPEYYQDVNLFSGHKYLPFPPMPSILIIPFYIAYTNITQQLVSIIIGSLNIALMYILLHKITNRKNSLLLATFFAFGTVHFWVSIVGTSWNLAHISALFLLLISLILSVKNKSPNKAFLSGIFFALSGLSRLTIIFGGLFFLINYWNNKKNLFCFLLGASIFLPIIIYYNYLRFGNIFETGYIQIYINYTKSGHAYSIQRIWHPESSQPDYLDITSIPYHLYTLFLMPPEINDLNLFNMKPSPYGMGIVFISPLLLYIFKSFSNRKLEIASWLGAVGVSSATFFHYAQGWVQFGYRFLLDFMPFLMIILAIKFKPSRVAILLIIVSIVVNYWGVNWGIKLGW